MSCVVSHSSELQAAVEVFGLFTAFVTLLRKALGTDEVVAV